MIQIPRSSIILSKCVGTKKYINILNRNGQIITDRDGIENEAISFFQSLLGDHIKVDPMGDASFLSCIPNCLDDADNVMLCSAFTLKEFKVGVFGLHLEKAS